MFFKVPQIYGSFVLSNEDAKLAVISVIKQKTKYLNLLGLSFCHQVSHAKYIHRCYCFSCCNGYRTFADYVLMDKSIVLDFIYCYFPDILEFPVINSRDIVGILLYLLFSQYVAKNPDSEVKELESKL